MEQEYITILAIGFIAGLLDYSFAVGFGLIVSLIMVGLLGMNPLKVIGAIAFAQVVTSIPAVIAHNKAGNIQLDNTSKKVLLTFSLSSFITAGMIALTMTYMNDTVQTMVYTIMLALIPLLIVTSTLHTSKKPDSKEKWINSTIYGILAGAYKAVVGGGYSLIIVAAQTKIGINLKTAIASSPIIKILPFTVITITYYTRGEINFIEALFLTVGSLLSIIPASHILKHIMSEDYSGKAIYSVLVMTLLIVLYKLASIV